MGTNPVTVKFGAETENLRKGVADAAFAVRDASRQINQALKSMGDQAQSEGKKAADALSGSGNSISSSIRKLQSDTGLLASVPARMSTAVGMMVGSLAAAGVAAIKMGADYERSLFSMSQTFGERTTEMVARSQNMAERIGHYFNMGEIQYAFIKTADSMARYGIQGQQYMQLVERAADIAAAKNMELKESIDRLESAMRGEAEASEYLGVTLNDTYMKTMAFDGALKDHWETMSDVNKAQYRLAELLQQTEKYTGAAEAATTTFSGAMSTLWNTLKDRVGPALSYVSSKLGEYVGLINKAMSLPTLDEIISQKRGSIGAAITSPFSNVSRDRLQSMQMDYLDSIRARQAGVLGTTGDRSTIALPAPDPDKTVKAAKESLDTLRSAYANSGKAAEWSAAKEVEHWQALMKGLPPGKAATEVYQLLGASMEKLANETERATKAKGKGGGGGGSGDAEKEARARYQADMAEYRLQLEEYRDNGERRVEIARQMAERAAQEYGRESREYIDMLRTLTAETNRYNADMAQLREIESRSKAESAQADLEIKREGIEAARDLGQITAQQELIEIQKIEDEKYRIELEALYRRFELRDMDALDQAETYAEIHRLQEQHRVQTAKRENQMAMETRTRWKGIAETMTGLFGGAISGLISGTQSLAQAMGNIFAGMVSMIVNLLMDMVAAWIVGMIVGKTSSTALAMGKAAEGAAAAGASVAHIPYVGWSMAPGVAASTFAMLSGYAMMASAAGGYDVPGSVNPITQLHGREMVLPAHLAERVRGMTEPGGSGGLTLNIHATDARSFEQQLSRSSSALSRQIKKAYRDFHIRPRTA